MTNTTEIAKLKVGQLREMLVNEFGYTNQDAQKIKGKANLVSVINEAVVVEDLDGMEYLDNLEDLDDLDSLYVLGNSDSPQQSEQSEQSELSEQPGQLDLPELPEFPELSDLQPQPSDPEWTDYVLAELVDNEKIKDKTSNKEYPTTDGLRRLVEKFVGVIISSDTNVNQVPTPDNERRATVVVKIGIMHHGLDIHMSFSGAADVYSSNSASPFSFHPVATAETKSEGRAYKRALKIKVSTYEEMAMGQSTDELSGEPQDELCTNPQYIKIDQVNFIDTICSRLDINIKVFIKDFLPNFNGELAKLPYDESCAMLAILQKYQGKEKDIKEEFKGYRGDWQVVWNAKPLEVV